MIGYVDVWHSYKDNGHIQASFVTITQKKVRQFDWEKRQKGVAAHTKQGECVKKNKNKKKTRRSVDKERELRGSHTIWSGKV